MQSCSGPIGPQSSMVSPSRRRPRWSLISWGTSCTRGLIRMENQPAAALRRRRQALLRQLPPLKEILRGSLIERYKRCGKPGCKCADGPGHGPKYYLSVSHPGLRPQMDYVPQESHAQITEFIANYHRAREILEAISEINRELLRRREAL